LFHIFHEIQVSICGNIKRWHCRIVDDFTTTKAYPAITIFFDTDGTGASSTGDFVLGHFRTLWELFIA
jgi:hypothetical protein